MSRPVNDRGRVCREGICCQRGSFYEGCVDISGAKF